MPHNHMIWTQRETEEAVNLHNKMTAIIPTSQSDMRVFMWSVLSLLLNTEGKTLEHIIIPINGCDPRTGDPSLQDRKQAFTEELRDTLFGGITIQRCWSRLGHSESLDAVMPWVHTDGMIVMHDDTLVMCPWENTIHELLYSDPKVALCCHPPLLNGWVHIVPYKDSYKLGVPHMNTSFMFCKKAAIAESGAKWKGYHIEKPFKLTKEFVDHYNERHIGHRLHELLNTETEFSTLSVEVGAWVYYELEKLGYEFRLLPQDMAYHLRAMSWRKADFEKDILLRSPVQEIIGRIEDSKYGSLYRKYLDE